MEKTNGHTIKLKSDVAKTSNDLNAFKAEMDKHLTKTNFENQINKLEQEFQKLSSDVNHISKSGRKPCKNSCHSIFRSGKTN